MLEFKSLPGLLVRSIAVLTASVVLFSSAIADMTVNVGGRIQVDAALYDEDVTSMNSGTEARRARIFLEGDIDKDWSYKAQYDFASSSDIKDLYLSYSGFDWGGIAFGSGKVPFGLEEMTSSKYVTFMERALPMEAFAPSRRVGVWAARFDDNYTLHGMVYGDDINNSGVGDEGFGIAGRGTWTPIKNDNSMLHLGLALAWQEPDNTDSSIERFRTRPESHQGPRFVDTTIADADNTTLIGLEAAYVTGGFSAQGEYIRAETEQGTSGVSDPEFDGFYGYVSWFPSGTMRPYKNGSFGRVKAEKVWEFAARFSSVDLDDGPFTGGQEDNITIGVNYYVTPYLRFMANYIDVDVDDGANGDEDAEVFQIRAAMDFK